MHRFDKDFIDISVIAIGIVGLRETERVILECNRFAIELLSARTSLRSWSKHGEYVFHRIFDSQMLECPEILLTGDRPFV
jgi:hypothetical protein